MITTHFNILELTDTLTSCNNYCVHLAILLKMTKSSLM
jgi:hypothetical protein